jgi:hypothetical protein
MRKGNHLVVGVGVGTMRNLRIVDPLQVVDCGAFWKRCMAISPKAISPKAVSPEAISPNYQFA